MKQLITAFAIAAMLPMSLSAANECPYDITWYQGRSFSGAAVVSNNTAAKFGTVYGIFPDGTTIDVPAGKTVSISGPADSHLNKTAKLGSNPSKSQQDPGSENPGDIIQVVYPGISFSMTTSEFFPIETPGVYTVSVPAGSFTVNGTANVAFDVSFTVEDNTKYTPVDMTVSPTPIEGTSADQFTEFRLKVTNEDESGKQKWQSQGVKFGSQITVIDLDTKQEYKFDIKEQAAFTYSVTYTATCDPAITKSGNYKVVWPEGFMRLRNKSSEATETNKELSYTYVCTGNGDNTGGGDDKPVTGDIVWSQGNQWSTRTAIVNNTVNALGTLWGVMEGKTLDVPYGNNPARKKAIVKGPAEGYTEGKEVDIDRVLVPNAAGDGTEVAPAFKVLCADYPKHIEYPGDYTITIPTGAFTIDGAPNAEIVYNVKVEDTRTYTPVDLPIDHVSPTPDGVNNTTEGTLANISIYISNDAVNDKRPYQSMGVSQTIKPYITLPDGTSRTFDMESLGSWNNVIRYYIKGDYGYTAAGKYVLTVPEGAMHLIAEAGGYVTNKTLTYTWTLAGKPASGDHNLALVPSTHDVQALAGIEVSSPEDLFLRVNDPSKITVTTPSGEVKVLNSIVTPNELYINCFRENEIFTAKGKYTFSIAEGAISFVDENGNAAVSTRSYSYDYNVAGGEIGDLAYTLTDVEGTEIASGFTSYAINTFYVKFNEAVTPTTYPYVTVVYPDGSKHFIKATWGGNPGRFQLFMEYPKQMGEYKITFPAGAAMANGVFNKAIEFTVNQIEQERADLALTSSPENGSTVTELLSLALIGNAEQYTRLSPVNGGITMTYFQNDDDAESRQMQYLKTGNDPLRLSIELDEAVTEVGDYTWTIPAESILAVTKDGAQLLGNEVKFYWSIRQSGVAENICDDDATVTVYDVNGVCILNEAAREELAKLPKGMYIINGKTFILK